MKAAFLTGLVLLLAPIAAQATILEFELEFEFSEGSSPAGLPPWLTATFDDSFGDANTVRLTMNAVNLVDQEFAGIWLFNFEFDPTQLAFAAVDNTASVPDAIGTGVDAFKADGDGFYDISFDFPEDSGSRFAAGETVIYDITYVSAIDVSSFNHYSVEGGGQGTYKTAAQIQGIGPCGTLSGWIGTNGEPEIPPPPTVPEPGTLLLLGSGLAGFVGYSRFRRRKK